MKQDNISIAVDVVVFTKDKKEILLVKRGNNPFRGMWALPGGKMELSETLERAAKRELKEETGIKDVSLRQLGIFDALKRDSRGRVISVAYLGFVSSNVKIKAGSDAKEVKWFSLGRLPKLAFDHKKILKYALRGFGR